MVLGDDELIVAPRGPTPETTSIEEEAEPIWKMGTEIGHKMKDTIEEKIVDLHGAKKDLADSRADMKMSRDELLALIRES